MKPYPGQEELDKKTISHSVYQRSDFVNLKEKCADKSRKVSIIKGDKILAKITCFEKEIVLPILGRKRILVAQGNPLFINEVSAMELLQEFKKTSENYFYGTIMPTVLNSRNEIFEKAGYTKVSNSTVILDLNKSEELLRSGFEKKSIRWGIKTAEKNALKVEECKNLEEIEEFYELYKSTAEVGGFSPERIEFIKGIVQSDMGKLFLVKKERRIVAGGLFLTDRFNNYTILDLTSSSNEGLTLQAMPFLYHHMILYSKRHNFNYFDFGGYDREAKPGEKTYNINKFKDRFGGNIVEQPIYSTNKKYPFLRSILRKVRFTKKFYRQE